ncbi:MAG: hypothetical protein ACR2LP_01355 [Candidatus Limnocylindrales bacterium]|nr:zinc ribbon domain-containing protein [Chloroflexota bacterium]
MADDRGRSRRESAPWVAPETLGGETRCQLCGAINSAAAPFCRWCGTPRGRPTDPVLGVTTRRSIDARSGSSFGALAGAVAGIAVIGLVAWLVLGGGLGRVSSLLGLADPGPTRTASLGSPAPSVDRPGPSGEPSSQPASAPPTAPPTPDPTASPTMSPSDEPEVTEPPAQAGFTCEPATVSDASSAAWTLSRARFGPRGTFDQLGLVLDLRRQSSQRSTVATVESLEASQVSARYGIDGPTLGDRALVITFDGPVVAQDFATDPDLQVIRQLQVANGSDGLVHVVLGVAGDGCHRLSAPGWAFGGAANQIEVILDIRAD